MNKLSNTDKSIQLMIDMDTNNKNEIYFTEYLNNITSYITELNDIDKLIQVMNDMNTNKNEIYFTEHLNNIISDITVLNNLIEKKKKLERQYAELKTIKHNLESEKTQLELNIKKLESKISPL